MLKNLTEERQGDIIELVKEKGFKEAKSQLAQDGIITSLGALSEFCSWWRLCQRYRQRESAIGTILENLRVKHPELTPDELFNYGQDTFSVMALEDEDPENWARIQLVRQRQAKLGLEGERIETLKQRAETAEQELKLAREKFQFDAVKAVRKNMAALNSITERSDLEDDAKLEQIRLKLFGQAEPASK